MTFSLQTFGQLQLLDTDGKVTAFPEKGLLIVAYLLTTPERSAPRKNVAQFLWGEAERDVALVNLRSTILRIKSRQRELGAHFLSFTSSTLSLEQGAIESDLVAVQRHDRDDPMKFLCRLVALFNRPFLASIACQSREFDAWLLQRKIYHGAIIKGLLRETYQSVSNPKEEEMLKNAALLLFHSEPENPDTLKFVLQIFNAADEVEYFQTYLEKRRQSLSRGLSALAAKPANFAQPKPAGTEIRKTATADGDTERTFQLDRSSASTVPRLALLPPSNEQPDSVFAAVASSLIEDITIGFCALNSVEIIAPHTAIRIRKTSEDKLDVFGKHDITYALDTRLSGGDSDSLSLFVQLIHVSNSEIIWAERYNLGRFDLLERRRDILRQITLSVAGRIESYQVTRPYFDRSAAAYHRYLVGRHHLNRLTLQNLRRSRKELKGALQEDENFAPALSSMARTYSKEWLLTARGDIDLLHTAAKYATRAIEARRDFADGYRELGVTQLFLGALDESAQTLELAETFSPNYSDIIADHADTLNHLSQPGLALKKLDRAIELNPLAPDAYLWTAAGASYSLGKYDDAIGYIDTMVDSELADRISAASWAMLGDKTKSRFFVRRALEANPQFDVDNWLAVVPFKERWQKDIYREGLKKAGF